MLTRCYFPSSNNFEYYGGRGITVCQKWKGSFQAFAQWSLNHGFYIDLTIDRKDNDGNYTPENCRWITMGENNRNRHVTRKFIEARRQAWIAGTADKMRAGRVASLRAVIASDGVIYPSAVAASRAIGLGRTAVGHCLRGDCKTSGGLTWRYL